ncbi:DUF2764 family protein [Marinilabiliaceae bacterium JC040]|nr:DUF2764 family protein [Marinilabiliaceae bacterium JC040]
MFENKYYCLIAGLPDIVRDDTKVPVMIEEFKKELNLHLSNKDMRLVNLFFLERDNKSLISLLRNESPVADVLANYSIDFLESQISSLDSIPPYMKSFILDYKDMADMSLASQENKLASYFFDFLLSTGNGFVSDYFEFEMNLRNLSIALNCRKYNREIASEIVGDNSFAIALKSSKLKDFGLGDSYPYVEKVVSFFDNLSLTDKEREFDSLRWEFLEEKITFKYFTIEVVVSYLVKLLIIERWSKLDSTRGKEIFNDLIKELKNSFEFTEEYSV